MKNVLRKGFTLVEITVVIAIVAVLSIISVSFFAKSRDYQQLNHVTQRLKSDIRITQSNALSIQGLCPDGTSKPKMWLLNITTVGSQRRYFCPTASPQWIDEPRGGESFANFSSSVTMVNSQLNLVYSTPTGKFQLFSGSVTGGSQSGLPEDRIYDIWTAVASSPVSVWPTDIAFNKNGEQQIVRIDQFGTSEIGN